MKKLFLIAGLCVFAAMATGCIVVPARGGYHHPYYWHHGYYR
jgi:hypothetical protein